MTDLDLCNLALARIGEYEIGALSGGRVENLCGRAYPYFLKVLLRRHRWNFAVTRPVVLVAAGVVDTVYSHSYNLPADCLRVLELWSADSVVEDFDVSGRKLFCDLDSASLVYVRADPPVDDMDALFQEVFVLVLAAELARTIKPDLASGLLSEAEMRLSEAKRIDANEGKRRLKPDRDRDSEEES